VRGNTAIASLLAIAPLLALALMATGGCVGSSQELRPAPAPPAEVRVPELKAELIDEETPLPDGRVSWSTRWRLCWGPVPGAVAYVVTTITPEGVGPPGETTDRCLVPLTVASGITDRPGARPSGSRQVDPMQQLMLAFTVAARFADGTVGPASPAIPLGRTYP